jgi:ferredoxin-NADP reductase/MOSC domain-containing protein YiiM
MKPNTSVVALSRSNPVLTDIRGRQLMTSIVRDPIPGPLQIGPEGPLDNSTAVHTEHTLAFTASHYDFWARELGVPREQWNWALWGENFTVDGVDEEMLRIGDVVKMGTAEFEVTSPRVPCFKVAWRVGQPDTFLLRMMETGRVGFHLAVLKPGLVSLGDTVEFSSSQPQNITVADLSRLLLSTSIADVEKLRATLAIPALGKKAAGAVRRRIALIEDRERMRIGRWRGWRRFVLAKVDDEIDGVRSFHLQPTDDQPLAPPAPGQFLSIKTEKPGEPDLVRTWSISDVDLERRLYRITIKAIEGGAGSHRMHKHLQVGDAIWSRPPAGQFVLDRAGHRRIALFSAGIGVTPMMMMLKGYIERGQGAPPLVWLQVATNGRTHPFKAEIAALLAQVPEVRRIIYYTRPGPEDRVGIDYDRAGRPTEEQLREIFGGTYPLNLFGRELPFPGKETEAYICGPQGFQDLVRNSLLAIGTKPSDIRSEAFVVSTVAGEGLPAVIEKATVRFKQSGITAEWYADDGQTLLDLAETAGLTPPYACRSGLCQSCECAITAGDVQYDPKPSVSVENGRVLICCSRPATEVIELDL